MQKNTAGKWIVFAYGLPDHASPGEPVTGDAANITANMRIDGAAANAIDDTNPTELEDGFYIFDITAAESNGDNLLLTPQSSTAEVQVIGVPGAVWTTPPYFNALGIASDGDISGNVDGSVASVTGAVGSVTGSVGSLVGHTVQTGDSYARIGAAGAGLTGVPWNASWDAEVQSEVDDALVARSLHYLVDTALPTNWGTNITANSALDYIADDGTASYDRTTESLQALRDHIADGSNLTEAGGDGDHLTAINLPNQTMDITGTISTVTDLTNLPTIPANWITAAGIATDAIDADALAADAIAEINATVDTALGDYDAPTKAEMDSAFTEIKGATWAAGTDTLEHIRNKQTDIETDTQDLQTQIGTAGDGLTGIPWNAAWDTEVQSEVADAFAVYDPATHAELTADTDAILAILGTPVADVATDIAGLQSDTDDIQTRLPAALVGGRMDSNMSAINNSNQAAINLGASALGILASTTKAGTLTDTACTTNYTEATADHIIGRHILFTTGVLIYQASLITDFDGTGSNGLITYDQLTEAPGDGDSFVVI